MSKFQAYNDPGHAWVKVPRALLIKLGVEKHITPFSYERGEMVYLEEDLDYGTFLNAMRSVGKTVELVNNHANRSSKIRSYRSFSPRT